MTRMKEITDIGPLMCGRYTVIAGSLFVFCLSFSCLSRVYSNVDNDVDGKEV